MAYVEDGLYLWECDAWEAPRPIAVKEGWATGQDINLPADWIDHGTLTPLIALTPELLGALKILLYGVQDWTGGDMTLDQAYEIVRKAIEGEVTDG